MKPKTARKKIVGTKVGATIGACVGVLILMLTITGCDSKAESTELVLEKRPNSKPETDLEIPSDRNPDATTTGTVSYNERIALSPDATLVIELRDVSYAYASAELIAHQTIANPGQVPVK